MRYFELLFERNVMNTAEIDDFVMRAMHKARSPEVRQWLKRMLTAYLRKSYGDTKPVSHAELDDYFHGNVPDWAQRGLAAGDLVTVSLTPTFGEKVAGLIDYLESEDNRLNLGRVPFEQDMKKSEDWHKSLAATPTPDVVYAPNHQYDLFTDNKGEIQKTLKRYADGFSWIELLAPECLDAESMRMGHCVGRGGYDAGVREGTTRIISLRDPEDAPHITIEVRDGSLRQVKGKQNKVPVAKYRPYVLDLLNNVFEGVKTEDAYDLQMMGIYDGAKGYGDLFDVAASVEDMPSGNKYVVLGTYLYEDTRDASA